MVVVVVKEGEALDEALKRFRKECLEEGIMEELRKRQYYISPSKRKRLLRKKYKRIK